MPGRYGLHDLLRSYAREQLMATDPPPARTSALRRVLDWYVHTAFRAEARLNPVRKLEIGACDPIVHPRTFDDRDAALLWCDTERANLVAAVRDAAEHGLTEQCWSLAQCLWDFFNLRKHRTDWIDTHRVALTAARSAGDRIAEGRMLITLGIGLREIGRHDDAIECYQQALAIWRAIGDRAREQVTMNNLGIVYFAQGRAEDGLRCYERCAELARELGDRHTEAVVLNNIGLLHAENARFSEAHTYYRQALAIRREIDDPYSEAILLNNIGEVLRGLLDFPEAVSHIDRALETFRRIGDIFGQAESLDNLGLALDGLGERPGAEKCWLESADAVRGARRPQGGRGARPVDLAPINPGSRAGPSCPPTLHGRPPPSCEGTTEWTNSRHTHSCAWLPCRTRTALLPRHRSGARWKRWRPRKPSSSHWPDRCPASCTTARTRTPTRSIAASCCRCGGTSTTDVSPASRSTDRSPWPHGFRCSTAGSPPSRSESRCSPRSNAAGPPPSPPNARCSPPCATPNLCAAPPSSVDATSGRTWSAPVRTTARPNRPCCATPCAPRRRPARSPGTRPSAGAPGPPTPPHPTGAPRPASRA